MAIPTENELELIQEIRERISDLDVSKEYLEAKNLVRFLRARNQNLNQAEDMIRKNVCWYECHNISTILEWNAEPNFKENFPWSVVGFDDLGGPLIVLPIGRWNPAAVAGNKEDFIRLSLQYFETVWSLMKVRAKGKQAIPQFTIILDLQGLGWRHYTTYDALQGLLIMVRFFEANYPDTLRLGVFVNAPTIFGMFWKLIKPMVSEVTHNKLQFLGSDKKLWARTISQFAKEDQFPKHYGGNVPDNQQISLADLGVCKYVCDNGNECY